MLSAQCNDPSYIENTSDYIVLKAYFHGAYSGQQGKLYSIALSIPQYKGDDHLEWMDYVAEMEQVLIEKILLKEP